MAAAAAADGRTRIDLVFGRRFRVDARRVAGFGGGACRDTRHALRQGSEKMKDPCQIALIRAAAASETIRLRAHHRHAVGSQQPRTVLSTEVDRLNCNWRAESKLTFKLALLLHPSKGSQNDLQERISCSAFVLRQWPMWTENLPHPVLLPRC